MALRRLRGIPQLYRTIEIREFPLGISRENSNATSNDCKYRNFSSCLLWRHVIRPWSNEFSQGHCRSMSFCANGNPPGLPWTSEYKNAHHTTMAFEFSNVKYIRLVTTQAKAPAQARLMVGMPLNLRLSLWALIQKGP